MDDKARGRAKFECILDLARGAAGVPLLFSRSVAHQSAGHGLCLAAFIGHRGVSEEASGQTPSGFQPFDFGCFGCWSLLIQRGGLESRGLHDHPVHSAFAYRLHKSWVPFVQPASLQAHCGQLEGEPLTLCRPHMVTHLN